MAISYLEKLQRAEAAAESLRDKLKDAEQKLAEANDIIAHQRKKLAVAETTIAAFSKENESLRKKISGGPAKKPPTEFTL